MDDEGLTVKKPRYITYYGYFGPTSNVKDAPAPLTGAAVASVLASLPQRPAKGGAAK